MKKEIALIFTIMVFILCGIPFIITLAGRKYGWDGFGTVPFSENYSVLCLVFIFALFIGGAFLYSAVSLIVLIIREFKAAHEQVKIKETTERR